MNRSFFNAVLFRTLAMASGLVTGMVSLRLYSRYFGPEAYGLVLVALQILAYLSLLDGGFRTVVNRRILAGTEAPEREGLIHFGQVLYSWLSIIAVCVALLVMGAYAFTPNARLSGQPPMLFLCLGLTGALSFLNAAQCGLLVGLRAQERVFLLNMIGAWVNLGALWAGLRAGAGLWSFVLGTLAVCLVTCPLGLHWIRQRTPVRHWFSFRVDSAFWNTLRELKSEAWACFRSQVATLMLYSADVIIVGLVCGALEAAVYGTLSRLFTIMRSFLQSSGEGAWPLIAEKGLDQRGFADPLLRFNAWAYGAVLGAAAPTLLPFCLWYVGASWTATPVLLALFIARYLVTGLAVPASYCLFGLGRMELITRSLQRELAVGLVLGLVLQFPYGMNGVAAGFALATFTGTFLPLLLGYAEVTGSPVRRVLFGVWWRAGAGFATSFLVASLALHHFAPNWQTMLAGLLGVVAGMGLAFAVAFIRSSALSARDETCGRLHGALRMI